MFDCVHYTLQQLSFDAVIRLTMMVRVRIETGRGCGVELDDAAGSWLMEITHYQDCNAVVTAKNIQREKKYFCSVRSARNANLRSLVRSRFPLGSL